MTRPRRHEPDPNPPTPAPDDTPPPPEEQGPRLRPGHRGSAARVRQAITDHAARREHHDE